MFSYSYSQNNDTIKLSNTIENITLLKSSKKEIKKFYKERNIRFIKRKYKYCIDTRYQAYYQKATEYSNDSLGIKFIFKTNRKKIKMLFKKEIAFFELFTISKKRLTRIEIAQIGISYKNIEIGKSDIIEVEKIFGESGFKSNNHFFIKNNDVELSLWFNKFKILSSIKLSSKL